MGEAIKMFQTLNSNSNNLANYPKGEPVICFEKNACLCLENILLWQTLHVSACFKCNFYIKAKWKTVKNSSRHNRLGAITLIGIVLSGRCPGVICPWGQLS